jgi:hypothetical protein
MGSILRILVIVTLALVAYELFMQYRQPNRARVSGRFAQVRQFGRKARLVALIYVCVIVASGIARIAGWID